MDKYEYKLKADEIKELISQGEYAQAAEIADTIDWRRVKSVMMLCTISDLYKINRRYEEARDMLLLAYERRPGGRTIVYSLCELSIKMEEIVQAVEYFKEFVQVAPKDSGRYILQYKLYEAQDVSLEERIDVLEQLKRNDYENWIHRAKWAYELAYLYHRLGLATRCVEECDEIILMFVEGKYVIKAMELKMLHQPLTPSQQEKYDHRFGVPVEELAASQENYEEQGTSDSMVQAQEQELIDVSLAQTQIYKPITDADLAAANAQKVSYVTQNTAFTEEAQDSTQAEDNQQPEELLNQPEELEIQVKTVDVGQYNTMNLQAEIAAGLREVLGEDQGKAGIDEVARIPNIVPMLDSDTETLDYPEIDEVSEDDLDTEEERMEATEVFFGETAEIGNLKLEDKLDEMKNVVSDATGEIVMQQMRLENMGAVQKPVENLSAEPPKALAGVLSQESDGQISLVMPEKENIEKQITGQMSIDDILAEWERMKKENQEKREEEVRQHVRRQTGVMFTEFEAAVRDGLLEKLEREKMEATLAEAVSEEKEVAGYEETEADYEEPDIEEAVAIYEESEADYEEVEELAEIEEAYEEPVDYEETAAYEETEADYEEPDIDEAVAIYEESEADYEEAEELAEIEEAYEESPSQKPIVFAAMEGGNESTKKTVEKSAQDITEAESDKSASNNKVIRFSEAVEEPRPLTKEEKELYAPYIQSRSSRGMLIRAIDNISMAAYTGNVIITGQEGTDTLSLAKNMIREIQATDSNFAGRVAKITAQGLNDKDVADTIGQLRNGALIITGATQMSKETTADLYKCLQKESFGIIVVLEDTKKAMDRFLSDHEMLKSCFTCSG